jgi:hypothetical protein
MTQPPIPISRSVSGAGPRGPTARPEFLSVQDYKHVQRWADIVLERPPGQEYGSGYRQGDRVAKAGRPRSLPFSPSVT